MTHNFSCCAVESCLLVNDCDLLDGFSYFYLLLSNLTPSMRGSLRTIGFILGTGKVKWLGNNLVEVAWWSTKLFEHNTSTWQTHTDSHVATANAAPTHWLRRAAKSNVGVVLSTVTKTKIGVDKIKINFRHNVTFCDRGALPLCLRELSIACIMRHLVRILALDSVTVWPSVTRGYSWVNIMTWCKYYHIASTEDQPTRTTIDKSSSIYVLEGFIITQMMSKDLKVI